jgi:hypothetical protein
MRAAALLLLLGLARAEAPPDDAPAPATVAEAMLNDAVRLLARGDLDTFMDRHCGDCDTKSARDRWRRYQLSTATKNAPFCLHGEAPGAVRIARWQGDLAADTRAKAYLECGGGEHAAQQEARLPVPVTIERNADGELKITQLSI